MDSLRIDNNLSLDARFYPFPRLHDLYLSVTLSLSLFQCVSISLIRIGRGVALPHATTPLTSFQIPLLVSLILIIDY